MFSGHGRSGAAPASERMELADIFARYAPPAEHRLPARMRKVIRRVIACRTPALGGKVQWCAGCGFERYVYHSCRDRHCPKCQTQAKEAWRQARQLELLPVPYFHQVFTLPHELNSWVLAGEENQRALLKLLFAAASETLLEFGQGELGGQLGFTMVLHTWDQQLRPHFHLHALVASGALSADRTRWIAGGAKFLFPVRALSKKFRGRFLAGFRQLLDRGQLRLPKEYAERGRSPGRLLKTLGKKPWVVYSKAPFAGPAKLLDYLSRYTHRVAISNHRLVACRDGSVTFRYRDRADGDRRKERTLPAEEFIGRYLKHVLPSGFMRIRHYGFLANRYRRSKLARIRELVGARPAELPPAAQSAAEWLAAVLGIDPECCPGCGERLAARQLGGRQLGPPRQPAPPRRLIAPARRHLRGPPEAAHR